MTCAELAEEDRTVFQYENTTEGAILTISCLEGYSLPEGEVEFVCGSDGFWSSDPSNYQCVPKIENEGLCTAGIQSIRSFVAVLTIENI